MYILKILLKIISEYDLNSSIKCKKKNNVKAFVGLIKVHKIFSFRQRLCSHFLHINFKTKKEKHDVFPFFKGIPHKKYIWIISFIQSRIGL